MTDQTPKAKPTKRPRNWTKILLIVSLAFNLLIVAAVTGAFFKNEKRYGRHLDRASMGLGAYILALPEPAQNEIMSIIGKGSDDRRKFRQTMWQSRKNLVAALQAKPFSAEAVKAAMDDQRSGALNRTTKIQDAYLDAVTNMSEEERATHLARAEDIMKERNKKRSKPARD